MQWLLYMDCVYSDIIVILQYTQRIVQMKAKSFQQCLLQQMLHNQQIPYPSFMQSDQSHGKRPQNNRYSSKNNSNNTISYSHHNGNNTRNNNTNNISISNSIGNIINNMSGVGECDRDCGSSGSGRSGGGSDSGRDGDGGDVSVCYLGDNSRVLSRQMPAHILVGNQSELYSPQNTPIRVTKNTINQLQDQILKMRAKAARKTPNQPPTQPQPPTSNQYPKKQPRILKTQTSQPQPNQPQSQTQHRVPPMNYSTIYTRRSSLDQSLYDKALREDLVRKQWIDKKREEKVKHQLRDCSYQPHINQVSKQIMSRVNRQELYQRFKKKKQDSIKKIQQQQQQKQMKQCSFTPNIQKPPKKQPKSVKVQQFTIQQPLQIALKKPTNSNSHSTRANKPEPQQQHSVSIFDHLYADSKSRQIKSKRLQEKYLKQCVKQPMIDQLSRQITKNTNFQTRMVQYEKKKIQRYMEIKSRELSEMRESYRPMINSVGYNRSVEVGAGEQLYIQSKRQTKNTNRNNKKYQNMSLSIHRQHQQYQKQNNQTSTPKPPQHRQPHPQNPQTKPKSHSTQPQPQPPPQPQINKKSQKFYQQRKTMVFYQIFKLLDSDQDGVISISEIALDSLPQEIVRIIYPLVEELEVMDVELRESQFICSISNLFKTLTIYQKDILLGFISSNTLQKSSAQTSKQIKQQDPNLFIPKINQRSKIIASCNQRAQMKIHEYCSIREAEREKVLASQRLEKQKKELEYCTFQPKVIGKTGRI